MFFQTIEEGKCRKEGVEINVSKCWKFAKDTWFIGSPPLNFPWENKPLNRTLMMRSVWYGMERA